MSAEYVDFIVEEPSMEALLRVLLPQLLPETPFSVYSFQGKDELIERLPDRFKGYAAWLPQNHYVVVIVDRDDTDCRALKDQLEGFARQAGLSTRTRRVGNRFTVVNRIAIEELEAWYFGDWEAVRAAYPRVSSTVPRKQAYRNPDSIAGGTWEAFEREMQRTGYFKGGLRKIEAAEAIARHMDIHRNTSNSFRVFRDAISELATLV